MTLTSREAAHSWHGSIRPVRALHHYDSIGLLVPSNRTDAGYRLYTDNDLLRLQQILIGRALGLSLEEIRKSLDDPRFDRKAALLEQKARLRERVRETESMMRAIDAALAAIDDRQGAVKMEQLFEGFNPAQYEEEARGRWGGTDAFAEAGKRTKRYTAGKIAGRVAVEYQPYAPEMKSLPSSVTTQVDAVFDEGRKMVIAQAADPLSDRKTTIEVTVTVLK